jgi:hypothetical protein
MSDHDRGPYTPPSERLSFDPREPVRSGGPAPVTLIVSALILVGIIGGGVLLYKDGFRRKTDGPAIVGAPVGDLRTPADAVNAPAGLVVDKSDNSLAAAPPSAAAAAAPPPAVVPPTTPPPGPIATLPGPAPAASPPAAAAPPAQPPKPLTIASLADAAVAHGHAPPLRPALAVEPGSPPAGAAWAQVGAFSSAALADKGWNQIAHFAPTEMAGKGKQVEPTTHNGVTFYRTLVTGFASHAAAVAFCEKLTAAHKPCITR